MRGFWSQVITLAVIVQIALVTGKALVQNNQQTEHQLGPQILQNQGNAQRRDGYDYPAPNDHGGQFQDHGHLNHGGDHGVTDHGHHDDHHHDHHHDPGYWKKKLIWKPGWKTVWKPSKKQVFKPSWKKIWKPVWVPAKLEWKEAWKKISVPEWKEIWVRGEEKIWKPVWISEWFPTPDHHHHDEHHESHGWDRSDNNAAASQQTPVVTNPQAQLSPPQQIQPTVWQFPK